MSKPWEILQGDVRQIAKALESNSFDACLSDPPYGLSFMGKRWDYDVPSANTWHSVLHALKPGAGAIIFGGTRTYHRLVCAVEDGGFEIRDQIAWMYGCLSDDTEILIDGKWEPYHMATSGRLALCYDSGDDSFSWQSVQHLHVYPYSDTAYRVRSDRTDQVVTRNHRCLVERGGAYAFELAEDAARERDARVPVLESVQGLLDALPLPHAGTGDGSEGWIRDGASVGVGTRSKPVPASIGVRASREPRSDRRPTGESRAVRKQPRSQAVRASRFTKSDLARFESFHLDGIVWCVTVPTGAFVARRNGKVFVTGNSGFPKSLDVSKAMDKAAGATRMVVGPGAAQCEHIKRGDVCPGHGDVNGRYGETVHSPLTAPETDLARQWDGWGTALKPSHEPAVLARKALDGTVAENVQKWGCGALAIDACRIGTGADKGIWPNTERPKTYDALGAFGGHSSTNATQGRWPANVIMDAEAGALLDAQSGELTSGKMMPTATTAARAVYGQNGAGGYTTMETYGDTGGASRFFYTAKASQEERNMGCNGMKKTSKGADALRDNGRGSSAENTHPTVKPVDLMRYLATLILPPKRSTPRRILVPFSGSGSEMIGAMQAGWDEVVGIEISPEYIEIAKARIMKGRVLSRKRKRA